MHRWWKVLKIALVVLVALLAVVRLSLAPVARLVANRMLPKALGTEASVGSLHFGLLTGRAGLRELRIGQPAGFASDDGDLLALRKFRIDLDLWSLYRGPIVIRTLEADRLYLHVIRDRQGRFNLQALAGQEPAAGSPPAPGDRETSPHAELPPPGPTAAPARPVRVEHLAIHQVVIRYTGLAAADEPVEATLTNLNLDVRNFLFDPAAPAGGIAPAIIELTGFLQQPGRADARLGVMARMGPVGAGIPSLNAAVRAVGFEMAALGALLPPGVMTTLGGEGLDLSADIGASERLLQVRGEIAMDGGTRYPIKVGGTPQEPEYDRSSVFYGTLSRVGGGLVLGTAEDVGRTGVAVVKTAANTAGSLVGGAVGTIGGLGRALKATAVAGLDGDMKQVGQGLLGVVRAPVSGVVDTVRDTAGTVASGLAQSADTLRGRTALDAWRKAGPGRWEAAWAEARVRVERAPFPPVVD